MTQANESCPICGRECEKDVKRVWPDARCVAEHNGWWVYANTLGMPKVVIKYRKESKANAWHQAAQRDEVVAARMRESIEAAAKEVASWSPAKREAADVTSPEFNPPSRNAKPSERPEVVAARRWNIEQGDGDPLDPAEPREESAQCPYCMDAGGVPCLACSAPSLAATGVEDLLVGNGSGMFVGSVCDHGDLMEVNRRIREAYGRDRERIKELEDRTEGYKLAAHKLLERRDELIVERDAKSERISSLEDALTLMYEKWEDGITCHEASEGMVNEDCYIGNAVRLSGEEEDSIIKLLPPRALLAPNVEETKDKQMTDEELIEFIGEQLNDLEGTEPGETVCLVCPEGVDDEQWKRCLKEATEEV